VLFAPEKASHLVAAQRGVTAEAPARQQRSDGGSGAIAAAAARAIVKRSSYKWPAHYSGFQNIRPARNPA
jgi:hypothetical protein